MQIEKIINPKTGREIKVKSWNIDPRQIIELFRTKKLKTVKDLSWMLLSDKQSVKTMERQQGGDSAENNFALNIVENALDWTLGMRVHGFILACVRAKKMPKPFKVAASRSGDVYIILANGKVLDEQ